MPVKDDFGNTRIVMVPADVDEDTLGKIASMTGGQFFRATDTQKLDDTYAQIDRMEKTTHKVKHYEHVTELFAWAVVPGLLVLLAGFCLEQTRFRRLP
jgi:Ca-activated chloride channel family protein